MNYDSECAAGRNAAARAIDDCRATGDMPRLVRQVREMAADESGIGIGFLYEIAERAAPQRQTMRELGEKLA